MHCTGSLFGVAHSAASVISQNFEISDKYHVLPPSSFYQNPLGLYWQGDCLSGQASVNSSFYPMSAHISSFLIHCHACHLGNTWVYTRFGWGVPYPLRDIWQFKRCVHFSCSNHRSPHFLLLQLALSAILISSSTFSICHPKTLMKPLKPSWLHLLTWSHL